MIEKNKVYVVTGACGFLGKELTKRIVNSGAIVKTICLNEKDSADIKSTFGDSVQTLIGDISDENIVNRLISYDVEGVFHLAAFKYVGLAEKETLKCIKSNVIGSLNVLESSVESNVKFVMCTSTAAAVKVSGVYGASKMIMEKMFEEYSNKYDHIKFRTLRYGNILYSTGSVLCKWKNAVIDNKEIIITDENSTRFFTTLEESVDLIFESLKGEELLYVPQIKSFRMGDLLECLEEKYSSDRYVSKIKKIGLQPGENKHEKLSKDGLNSDEVDRFTKKEIMRLI